MKVRIRPEEVSLNKRIAYRTAKMTLGLALLLNLNVTPTWAKEPKSTPAPASAPTATDGEGEQVSVDAIKEKYWARGNETELGVVQNRTYSKGGRVEIGLIGGFSFSDPFLSTRTVGLQVGYHLSEYLSLNLVGFRYFSTPSAALQTFQDELGATTNTNLPRAYLGTEAAASVLYGKLSVLGQRIIYYDLHLLGGLGVTDTESGKYATPSLGIGQRFYVSQHVSFRVDYRMQYFHETVLEKQVITALGQPRGDRDNWSNVITLGVNWLF